MMPYLMLGNKVGEVKPFLYDPQVTHFRDDFKTVDNWVLSGSYDVTGEGLRLYGSSRAITRDSILDGKDRYAIVMQVSYNALGDYTLISLTDENGNPVAEIKWNSAYSVFEVYSGGNLVGYVPIDLSKPVIINKVGNLLIILDVNYFEYYVDLPIGSSIKKIAFGTDGADVTFKEIGVYESAGTRVEYMRIIWSGNRVLKVGDRYYCVITRSYGTYRSQPSIVASNDMVNFEPYKHIWLDNIPISRTQYAYHDGQYIYVWLAAFSEAVERAGFRIMVLDSNFNVVDVKNVTVNGLPEGAELTSVYFVNVDGKWYAIGSLFDGRIALFDTDGPWSPSLTFVKIIYSFGPPYDIYVRESVTAHLVTNLREKYVLALFFGGPVLLFDTGFESATLLGTVQDLHESDSLLAARKLLYGRIIRYAVR